eukprot:m.276439 g.276439  ORF g.276439 m.276439 type:complete len:59 (+) comp22865_c3_seq21:78-254(+)
MKIYVKKRQEKSEENFTSSLQKKKKCSQGERKSVKQFSRVHLMERRENHIEKKKKMRC